MVFPEANLSDIYQRLGLSFDIHVKGNPEELRFGRGVSDSKASGNIKTKTALSPRPVFLGLLLRRLF